MKLKVCGMRDKTNIEALISLSPSFIGFIFYPLSKRYVGDDFQMPNVPTGINKVGVFVNEDIDNVIQLSEKFSLDYVQLHGDESLDYVIKMGTFGIKVIKVFAIVDSLPKMELLAFQEHVDYFLFDTKTPEYGGSGNKFDWSVLKQYEVNKPFILSGGISLDDIAQIKKISINQLAVIDVNSKFEVEPGVKNIELVKALSQKI